MHCYVMEPWQTIRSGSTVTAVNQGESCWLDLQPYQDLVAWLEVKEVSTGGGTNVQLAYQTAPIKDESLFVSVLPAFNVAVGVTTTVMLKDSAINALNRWLRWQLTVTGSPSSTWDATFRIFIAANLIGQGNRPMASAAAPPGLPPLAGDGSASPTPPLHLDPTGGGRTFGIVPLGPPRTAPGFAPGRIYTANPKAGRY